MMKHGPFGTLCAMAVMFFLIPTTAHGAGIATYCGNGCSTERDGSTSCTNWTKGTGTAQVCQAHALCSSECTTWPTSQNKAVNIKAISSHAKARRLKGARTFPGSRPPKRRK